MRALATVVSAGVLACLVVGLPPASNALPSDRTPGQTYVDNDWWTRLAPGGVASRPYVKNLTIIRGGVPTTIVDNPDNAPVPIPADGFDITIDPQNMCRADQTPGVDWCYATPNRIAVYISYVDDQGHAQSDFSTAPQSLGIDANTEFDLTLGLNTLGQTLRWTWLPGMPTYWQVSDIGQEDAVMHIRFKMRGRPLITGQGGGCTQIPVASTCEFTDADYNSLNATLLLSLDDTLGSEFTGALFATQNAYIGSLDASRDVTGSPALTWGMAAPVTTGGAPNAAKLWAVVSDASLLNYFGVPPEGDPRSLFAVSVDSGTGDPETGGWQRWSAAERGTDGWLISTNPVEVVSQVAAGLTRSAMPRARVARSVTVSMNRKAAAPQVNARYSAASKRTSVSFTGSRTLRGKCTEKGYTCRVRVERLRSLVGLGRTEVANVSATVTSGGVTASVTTARNAAPSRARVIVLLERKGKSGGWKYLASTGTTVGT